MSSCNLNFLKVNWQLTYFNNTTFIDTATELNDRDSRLLINWKQGVITIQSIFINDGFSLGFVQPLQRISAYRSQKIPETAKDPMKRLSNSHLFSHVLLSS